MDRASIVLVALALVWGGLSMVPLSVMGYSPGVLVIEDTIDGGSPPRVKFDREIKREIVMEYTVTMGLVGADHLVCTHNGGPFTYNPDAKLPPAEALDLVWWTDGNSACWPQDAGTYSVQTCWTMPRPFAGLVAPKTVCRNARFTVHPAAEK